MHIEQLPTGVTIMGDIDAALMSSTTRSEHRMMPILAAMLSPHCIWELGLYACCGGHLNILRRLCAHSPLRFTPRRYDYLSAACNHGQLEVVKWLVSVWGLSLNGSDRVSFRVLVNPAVLPCAPSIA